MFIKSLVLVILKKNDIKNRKKNFNNQIKAIAWKDKTV